ncbi:hypothetical protein C8Q78DRAFT_1081803 [Trametes maxima]|nr:hypothetical protein C8Q78DRAFT_1081803 [Trametes maxima]
MSVLVLVILDALHSIVAMHSSYWYLVVNYFNPGNLKHSIWSLNMQPVTTGIIIVICQVFFACRVYLVGRGFRPLVMIAATLLIAELGLASALTAKGFVLQNVDALNDYSWMQSAGFGAAVVSDVMLTCVLIVALYRHRSDFKQIDILVAYAVCTGSITEYAPTFFHFA